MESVGSYIKLLQKTDLVSHRLVFADYSWTLITATVTISGLKTPRREKGVLAQLLLPLRILHTRYEVGLGIDETWSRRTSRKGTSQKRTSRKKLQRKRKKTPGSLSSLIQKLTSRSRLEKPQFVIKSFCRARQLKDLDYRSLKV
jgi:hypothetical protein